MAFRRTGGARRVRVRATVTAQTLLRPPEYAAKDDLRRPVTRATVIMLAEAQRGADQRRVETFASTSMMTCGGACSANAAVLAFQSRLFNWSARTTPVICPFAGKATSNGYPFTWPVIGQHNIKLVELLYDAGLSTRAGRWPCCSCPACGEKSSHTMWPRSGT